MTFVPRLTKPEKGNKYYITKTSGGYSDAILGKPTDSYCNVLANCVGYAYGRFNEIGQWGSCKYLRPVNAENFMQYKGSCETGMIPKVGACMVWQKGKTLSGSDGAGHVAIVEQVNSDGSIVTSESGYNSSKIFWTRTRTNSNGNWGQGSAYKFLGFIYNPAVENNGKITKIPKYVGYLDTVSVSKITGWAWNSIDDTALKVDIKIFKNNTLIKTLTTTANIYRADLKNAQKGNGKHGFDIKFDFNALGTGTYTIKAYTNNVQLINIKTITIGETKYSQSQFISDVCAILNAEDAKIAFEKSIKISRTVNKNHALVTPLERYMKTLGYYTGNIEADLGKKPSYGSGMENAIKSYQKYVVKSDIKNQDGYLSAKGYSWKKLLGLS